MRKTVALLALLLLVAAPCSAKPSSAELSAPHATADGGTVQGPLVAFKRMDVQDASLPDAGFQLAAEAVHVVTERTGAHVSRPVPLSVSPRVETADYSDAVANGLAVRTGYQFEVFPLGDGAAFSAVSTCHTFGVPTQPEASLQRRIIPQGETHAASLEEAVEWATCAAAVEVRGSFLLALWEFDAELLSGGQRVPLGSGVEPAEPASAGYPTLGRAQQQFLSVTNGTLAIPSMDATTHFVYLQQASLEGDPIDLRLAQATGTMSLDGQEHALDGDDVVLGGAVAASFERQGALLASHISGRFGHAEADGIALATVAGATVAGPWLWWTLGGIGLAAAPAAVLVPMQVRRRNDQDMAALVEGAFEAVCTQDFPMVQHLACRALGIRDAGVAHMLNGHAKAELGFIESALRSHEMAVPGLREDPDLLAENAFFAALGCARAHAKARAKGQAMEADVYRVKATSWYGQAVAARPRLAQDAVDFPELMECLRPSPGTQPAWLLP